MQIFSFDTLGTRLEVRLPENHSYAKLLDSLGEYLFLFEKKYSRFIVGNWLYEVNKNRRGFLDKEGIYILENMLEVARRTGGYFDPTVGGVLTKLGYGIYEQVISSDIGYIQEKGYSDYRDIEILGNEIILHGESILEFGGVGKGYLLDQIHTMIEREGGLEQEEGYVINFGGDLYAKGGWKVGLESPFALDEAIGTISLDGYFLACSAGTRRKWGKHHHLIDPHKGESAKEVIATYIESCLGIIADAYATALCVMPWSYAIEILNTTNTISGVIVRYDGEVYQKNGSQIEIFS